MEIEKKNSLTIEKWIEGENLVFLKNIIWMHFRINDKETSIPRYSSLKKAKLIEIIVENLEFGDSCFVRRKANSEHDAMVFRKLIHKYIKNHSCSVTVEFWKKWDDYNKEYGQPHCLFPHRECDYYEVDADNNIVAKQIVAKEIVKAKIVKAKIVKAKIVAKQIVAEPEAFTEEDSDMLYMMRRLFLERGDAKYNDKHMKLWDKYNANFGGIPDGHRYRDLNFEKTD